LHLFPSCEERATPQSPRGPLSGGILRKKVPVIFFFYRLFFSPSFSLRIKKFSFLVRRFPPLLSLAAWGTPRVFPSKPFFPSLFLSCCGGRFFCWWVSFIKSFSANWLFFSLTLLFFWSFHLFFISILPPPPVVRFLESPPFFFWINSADFFPPL